MEQNRIQKNACGAVDGVLPERGLVTPEQAHKEAVRWLERLDRGEISTVISESDECLVSILKCISSYF